jgi:serine/threonine protein phosphatase PrpC
LLIFILLSAYFFYFYFILQIITYSLAKDRDHYMIIASDGVWEFISSEEAVRLVSTMPNPRSAAELLCKESVDRWHVEEPVCDDITALVVFVNR